MAGHYFTDLPPAIKAKADSMSEDDLGPAFVIPYHVVKICKGNLEAATVISCVIGDFIDETGIPPEEVGFGKGHTFTGGKVLTPANSLFWQRESLRVSSEEHGLDRYADFVYQYWVQKATCESIEAGAQNYEEMKTHDTRVSAREIWQTTGLKPPKVRKALNDLRDAGLLDFVTLQ